MRKHLFCLAIAIATATPATVFGVTPQEAATADRVANQLKNSGLMKNYRVGVRFENGMAWLDGTVASAEQARTALNIAMSVPGVERVMNRLEIAEPSRTTVAADAPSYEDPANYQEPGAIIDRQPTQSVNRGMPRPMRQIGQPGDVQPAGYGHRGQFRAAMNAPAGYMPSQGARQVNYDHANMPNYAWPSYAAHPNYAALTYPKQYSPSAWPYIGPFYPYPQVPLGWRKVTLEWDDGWWMLDFHE